MQSATAIEFFKFNDRLTTLDNRLDPQTVATAVVAVLVVLVAAIQLHGLLFCIVIVLLLRHNNISNFTLNAVPACRGRLQLRSTMYEYE